MNLINPKRFAAPFAFFALGLALSFTLTGQSLSDENIMRGVFLRSRKPSPTPTPKRDIARESKGTKGKSGTVKRDSPPQRVEPASVDGGLVRMGLGYSLYQRDEKGEAVRVDPTKVFRTGDWVRFVIEPNVDGYLYIFHAESGGEPKMIFPDPRLKEGDNRIKAHCPYEAPSRKTWGWFKFAGNPGIEHLYFVVTRKPLDGVPTGSKLMEFCGRAETECPWKPEKKEFNLLLTRVGETKVAGSYKELGASLSDVENDAIERDLKLSFDAPEPSLIVLNVSAKQDVLVVKTKLNHGKPE